MTEIIHDYEMVIGLEVHCELKTESKIFCGCGTAFGAKPNTQCCPVCTGMPGALPVLNGKVVEYAIKAGLATSCDIARYSKQDRKNYFYPDLPKAYQISQFDLPLCTGGYVDIEGEYGAKRIGITRIHIEEDAGKLVHGKNSDGEEGAFIDLNRCGVPLIEIVSEPDIRSAAEAVAYLKKLRAVLLYTGISDCRMNEGSFRCDVNLSVRGKGSKEFGTRTEMKNLNSFQFVAKAIEQEYKRQVKAAESGEKIIQETRRFDSVSGTTSAMRIKEDADDYRYFPDPDLMPIVTQESVIEAYKVSLPRLPDERKAEYMEKYGLSGYHSELLITGKQVSDYFDEAVKLTRYPGQLASIIISDIFRLTGSDGDGEIRLDRAALAEISDMLGDDVINSSTARKLISEIWENGGSPAALVEERGLTQVNDRAELERVAGEVIRENEGSVRDFQNGKDAALKALMGKAMAKTGGRGNPVMLQEIFDSKLKNN
ncbi:MAG: Asp-tRNA(Asn)/Glu-tRNA(Gln) amidotransferase subunit GatB [Oscillospiraceae bacterium]|jgi:aspartyl-tRNA(Asn)/glutamyl-tRNA(Gln) amidotransferase subunit B|nr:Asp-tRNA(Asn)/Glu-tRNA(Gln) amidotransferase subunit GatB [Oscillospiraceae bacterium]